MEAVGLSYEFQQVNPYYYRVLLHFFAEGKENNRTIRKRSYLNAFFKCKKKTRLYLKILVLYFLDH